jgi:glycosyltransferase involved in cell wall biosynthesis
MRRMAAGPWLVLTHAFNMDGRAASHTITDKIPHLLAHGVQPIVVSAVTGTLDKVVEHHQLLPASPVGLRFDLRFLLRRHVKSKPLYKLLVGLMTLLLLPFYIVEKLLVRLEPQWSWFLPAYLRGARLIRERKPLLILSVGSANSAHHAGYLLARRYKIPWVAEIHDPMIYASWQRSRMAYDFAAWLEGKICRHADLAYWFTEPALERARARHPELGERGKVMIPGADAPHFAKVPYRRGTELVIGHFGSLAPTRNLAIFLEGLDLALREQPALERFLRLEIYGADPDPISREAIARFAHAGVIREFGRLERDPVTGESGRDRVMKRMQTVDALLLLHGTDEFCEEYIPSKLYEYLWTQRPVFGLVFRNAHLERLLRERGNWAVPADDPRAIAAALKELAARWERDELKDSGEASPYTTAAAVEKLIGWVDAMLEARRP